jgi:hypothetical protein
MDAVVRGKINSQPQPGLEPLIIQPVAQRYTTELSRVKLYLYTTIRLQGVVLAI